MQLNIEKSEKVFHAMGDKMRRKILYRLIEKPCSISDLANPLNISLTAVNQHIKILEESELVQSKKIGRNRICEFNPEGFDFIAFWTKHQKQMWQNRFAALKNLLDEE